MKALLLLALGLIVCLPSLAQSAKYQEAMTKNVQTLDTAMKTYTLQSLANNFERIAKAEKNQWLPYYYAGYCYTMLIYREKDIAKIDEKVNNAEALVQLAEELKPENSEIYCLKSMLAIARIRVDFMSRGPKYSVLATEYLMSARTFDPSNPRVYLLLGEYKYSTPEQFGGDKKLACQLFEKAHNLYQTPPSDPLAPKWGKNRILKGVQFCQKELTKNSKAD